VVAVCPCDPGGMAAAGILLLMVRRGEEADGMTEPEEDTCMVPAAVDICRPIKELAGKSTFLALGTFLLGSADSR
jgi:hypothetical protein